MISNNTYTSEEKKGNEKTSKITSGVVTAIVVMITLAVIYWMPA